MTPIELLFLAFATYYLSYAAVHLDLPFNVGKLFRERVTTIGGMLLCFLCCAWWVALILYVVQYRTVDLIMVSAIAGAACLAYKYTGGHFG